MSTENEAVRFDPAKALSLKAVRNRMTGRGGKRPHLDTLRRYVTVGCRVRGQLIKLKAVHWAGEWLTMPEWLARFERERLLGGMS
jgi:hypothetical protein